MEFIPCGFCIPISYGLHTNSKYDVVCNKGSISYSDGDVFYNRDAYFHTVDFYNTNAICCSGNANFVIRGRILMMTKF